MKLSSAPRTNLLVVQSKCLLLLLLTILTNACQPAKEDNTHFHLDFTATDSAMLFAHQFFSKGHHVRDFALSPSSDELFFSIQHQHGYGLIFFSKKSGNKWTSPDIASFSGHFTDIEPAFSPDGERLYFSSNRPVRGTQKKDFDIWFVERTQVGWSDPIHLGDSVNSLANEFYPSVAKNGNLYLTARYSKRGYGGEDINLCKYENGSFHKAIPLDSAVNSSKDEFNAYVSPDESFIIFSSWGRSDDLGGGDLYISHLGTDGQWLPSTNMGPRINSSYLDYCPFVSADGKLLFFTSNRIDVNQIRERRYTKQSYDELLGGPNNGNGSIYLVRFQSPSTHPMNK